MMQSVQAVVARQHVIANLGQAVADVAGRVGIVLDHQAPHSHLLEPVLGRSGLWRKNSRSRGRGDAPGGEQPRRVQDETERNPNAARAMPMASTPIVPAKERGPGRMAQAARSDGNQTRMRADLTAPRPS